MIEVYYRLVLKGLKTIDDIPISLREQVAELIQSDENNGDNTELSNEE